MTRFGVPPWLGYPLGLAAFFAVSLYLFEKTKYAPWLMVLMAVGIFVKSGEKERSGFLKSCFSKKIFYLIRLIENMVIALPFIAVLGWKSEYLLIILTIVSAGTLAVFPIHVPVNFTLPTPFYHRPFEFIAGFRLTWYLILISWFLAFMGIYHDNFNLGVSTLAFLFLLAISFYPNPENQYYIWIFNRSPVRFLIQKMKTAALYSTFLHLPVTVSLVAFYPGESGIIVLVLLLGMLFLMTVILAKYARFPGQINLLDVVILVMAIWFPLTLLVAIPYYYSKSIRNLRQLFG